LDSSYLFGVSDTDDNGDRFPDTMYEIARDYALEFLHTEIGVRCPRRSFVYKEDYSAQDWGNRYIHVRLPDRPVRLIKSVSFWYGSKKLFDCPKEWINLRTETSGQLRIVPVDGRFDQTMLVGFAWLGYFLTGYGNRLPDFVQVEYEAGWDIEELPGDLVHLAGMIQSMMMLNVAGDLIVGAGIANLSVGMDGLSQSIGTTSSATNAGYGARIIQYWKDIAKLVPALKAKYRGGLLVEVV
jgi:hypothetical protein